ncbi:23515_t:CDS:2 [Dentiscutata erythropus]|uniref:23515_t:CDS:1 n=1 Tax=Dentiscutata erythropus TaxID=1348616 RepID=A0A9N9HLY3_9GLOM|nr:23515_t:CDS:2 [Dentiscutata erythropus]
MWFDIKPKHITLELTEYYMKRGIFSDERFENTIDAILAENVTKNVIGLALLRYWKFAAIDQKEIGKVAQRLYNIKVNSAPYGIGRTRRKIRKTVTMNRITNSNNSKTATTHCETQLESSFEQRNERDNPIVLDLTENMHIPILDELTTTSYDMQNCHPAEHEGSKIELQYLFTHALSQPSFVRTLQQDIENNFVFSNN